MVDQVLQGWAEMSQRMSVSCGFGVCSTYFGAVVGVGVESAVNVVIVVPRCYMTTGGGKPFAG